MVRLFALFLCVALSACSQTGSATNTAEAKMKPQAKQQPAAAKQLAAAQPPAITDDMPPEEQYAALMARCEAAIRREQQKSVARARLGSALTMAAGFGGIGGAIAGDAISMGRSLTEAGAENSARTAIEKECMP